MKFRKLLPVLLFTTAAFAQTPTAPVVTWEDILFEPKTDYGAFACRTDAEQNVRLFFDAHPLVRILHVCHNNCASLRTHPQSIVPRFARKIRGNGSVALHFLVDPDGTPLYVRALNGHSLIRNVLQRVWCGAKFAPSREPRQNVLFICQDDRCDAPQLVQQ